MIGEIMQAAASNPLTSAINSATNAGIQFFTSKKLAKYNYELGQKSLRNSPKNYKIGLIEAGINPILASNSPIGSTQGSAGVNPGMDLVGDMTKGFSAKMLKEQTESNVELQGKQGEAALKNADANKMQAEAAMKNAQTNEKMLTISGTNAGSNVLGTIGGAAKDAALIYTAVKGNKTPTAAIPTDKLKMPTSGNSAKGVNSSTSKAGKILSGVGAYLAPGLANYGTAAGLALPAAYYGIGKYMEGKGYGKIVDQCPNKNELRHRTGGLGNSSTKIKTSKRRHN